MLEGVLTPDGRAQKGEDEHTRAAVGWLHADIEVNDPHRLLFPNEAELDKQAKAAAFAAWKGLDWKSRLGLLRQKIPAFWLSTDQWVEATSFSRTQRRLRAAGVIIYGIVLVFAIGGWISLYYSSRTEAMVIAFKPSL